MLTDPIDRPGQTYETLNFASYRPLGLARGRSGVSPRDDRNAADGGATRKLPSMDELGDETSPASIGVSEVQE